MGRQLAEAEAKARYMRDHVGAVAHSSVVSAVFVSRARERCLAPWTQILIALRLQARKRGGNHERVGSNARYEAGASAHSSVMSFLFFSRAEARCSAPLAPISFRLRLRARKKGDTRTWVGGSRGGKGALRKE